jgi:phosphoglycolate phosphatase-like HAD superfamily hydrolase
MIKDNRIKLIIFDWDDVITLGSINGYVKCYHETLAQLGVSLDPNEEYKRIMARWGKSHREELRELLKERPELLDEACIIYERILFGTTFVDELHMTDGTTGILSRLRERYALSVATGADANLIRTVIMPKFNIPDVFSQILSVHDINDPVKHKPHPYMLEKIMRTHHIAPNETIFVGDARGDVLMAREARVEPVVVLTGLLKEHEAKELGVNHIIPSIINLPKILA